MQHPNMAVLAASAAVALDKRIHGTETPLTAVHTLAAELAHWLESRSLTSDHTALMGATAAALFGRTFITALHQNVRTMDELAATAHRTVDDMRRVDELNQDRLAKLRDICVALSRSALAEYANARVTPAHRHPK
jgi:hypothetical protein